LFFDGRNYGVFQLGAWPNMASCSRGHQYHSLRHWQGIIDKYSKVLDTLSSSKGNFGFNAITQWGLYKLKRFLFQPFAETVAAFNDDGSFYYARFIGAYKLHKVTHIDMLTVQDLQNFNTGLIPIRPIVASTGDYRKQAANWLGLALQPLAQSRWGVTRCSQQTIATYEQLQVVGAALLVEFDIKDFFLNINQSFCLKAMRRILEDNPMHFLPQLIDLAISVLGHLLKHCYFQFAGKKYQQAKGIPIGLDCASQLAAIIAWYVESTKGVQHDKRIQTGSWQRYLDDGLFVWNSDESSLKHFMAMLNTPCNVPGIGVCSFVYEYKYSTTQAVFLDLHYSKGKRWNLTQILDTCIFRKPQNPFAYIPCNSNRKTGVHSGWIRREFQRRVTHNSSLTGCSQQQAEFAENLIQRGYSGRYIRSLWGQVAYSSRAQFLQLKGPASVFPEHRCITIALPFHPQVDFRSCLLELDGIVKYLTNSTQLRLAHTARCALTSAIISHKPREVGRG
jgi:hypothetical protein